MQRCCVRGREMISLKEYAKKNKISYEAVRKQVKVYEEQLSGHIHIQNRMRYLDEEAEAFLDTKREKEIVVLIDDNKDTSEELIKENNALKEKIIFLQEQYIAKTEQLAQASIENKENKYLLEMQEAMSNKKIDRLNHELEEQKNSYKKTWFGLYKKVK